MAVDDAGTVLPCPIRWAWSLLTFIEPPATGGEAAVYHVPYRTAFDVALNACAMLKLRLEAQDVDGHYIVAKHGMSLRSYGERIGILSP